MTNIRYEYIVKFFPDFKEYADTVDPGMPRELISQWLSTFGAEGWELTFVVGGNQPEWYFRRAAKTP